jgi:hypothetical protein
VFIDPVARTKPGETLYHSMRSDLTSFPDLDVVFNHGIRTDCDFIA